MKTSVKISVFFPPKNVICFSKACKNIQMDTIHLHNIKHTKKYIIGWNIKERFLSYTVTFGYRKTSAEHVFHVI